MTTLHFLGAAEEVTGSMLLVETRAGGILVDCGMFQGRRAEAGERNRSLPMRAHRADAVILTHAHIDHSGSLPTLVKRGFTGAIWTTPATRDVTALMLADSARIQEADAKFLNRKFADDRSWVPLQPVYDEDDVVATMRRFLSVPYHHPFQPLPGVTATFRDAGHILGAASLHLDIDDAGRHTRLVVSGDLGRRHLPILRDPELPQLPVDYLVLESTYGNRTHPPVATAHDAMARIVATTFARGGKVVIPAFALGRTQEILYVLHELQKAGRLPKVPIFVDSPLATAVTSVYKLHADCFDEETRRFLAHNGDLFEFEGVRYIGSAEESMALNTLEGPAVIISASGMAESGRVLHHLRHTIEDPRSTIVIVGFMAQHTLGRRLAEGQNQVRILGVERVVQANVEVIGAFSAHADRDGLLAYADACGPALRKVFLVHGEPEQQEPLRDTLVERGRDVVIPRRGEIVELGA